MSRIVDTDGLGELFDIDLDADFFENSLTDEQIIESIDTEDETKATAVSNTDSTSEAEYINTSLKEMVGEVKDIISAAKYLINSSPDEQTITASSTLFSSAAALLKELNKGVLQSRKERHNLELEKLKITARRELAVFKSKSKTNAIGSGNTFNIDNRQQQISFSQESVVKEIIKANKENQDLEHPVLEDNDGSK